MRGGRIISLLLIVVISLSAAAPCFAGTERTEDTSLDTFLSVLNAWGGFLAKLTGAYDVLDNITLFSDFAREWKSFVDSDGFSFVKFIEAVLRWIGIDAMIRHDDQPAESYSL